MRVRPVVEDAATVVHAVAESLGHERMTVQQSVRRFHAHRARAEAVAAALRDPDRPLRAGLLTVWTAMPDCSRARFPRPLRHRAG